MPSPFPNLPPERRGEVHRFWLEAERLRGNPWGDPHARDLFVYTPPGWEGAELPAILVLPAFTGSGEGLLARGFSEESLAARIDRLIEAGCPPFFAVLPDCMTRIGGSQYVDSPALGPYATYVAEDVRGYVDAKYPVKSWGVIGRSSGGFGALHLAIERPGAFSAVASLSGDLGFDLAYLGEIGPGLLAIQAAGGLQAFLDGFWDKTRHGSGDHAAVNLLALSCAYSPDVSRKPVPARLPVDVESGAVDLSVIREWQKLDPVVRIEEPAAQEALRGLRLLAIDAGKYDEYGLHLGARRFARRLGELGIAHVHEEFAGGHRGTTFRYDRWLPEVARALSQ